MRRTILALAVLGFVFGGATFSARAAEPAAKAAPTGFRAEYIAEVNSVGKKLTDLAGAMPAEKYSWRPAPGIRSVSEVYVHVAGGDYLIPSFMGAKVPEGITRDMEKTVTEKAKVQEVVRQSFEHARKAAEGLSDADLAREIKLFGQPTTVGGMLFVMANHMHEHLGQSIAYARTNGVVPPWSAGKE